MSNIWHLWVTRVERNWKPRENIQVYARREPIDAHIGVPTYRQNRGSLAGIGFLKIHITDTSNT